MKGLMFSEEMFNAVIEGRKTQTRRIMKQQPEDKDMLPHVCYNGDKQIGYKFITTPPIGVVKESKLFKPRYKVGETVYIKEPYVAGTRGLNIYKYPPHECTSEYDREMNDLRGKKWQNKLFMPERHARCFIEITAVRCERLQDISDEDCLKEGIIETDSINDRYFNNVYENGLNSTKINNGFLLIQYDTPQQAYAALFDSINGKGSWESNPYVWSYSFILKKQPKIRITKILI